MVWVSTEHAIKAIRKGVRPPITGIKENNPYWHDLMASISTEIWGAFYPGMTQKAADGAEWFGRITNDDYAIHLAKFYAAMYSAAFFVSDLEQLIRIGLEQVPPNSALYQGIRDVQRWRNENSNWRDTRRLIYDRYYSKEDPESLSSIVDALPNGLMGMLYSDADFKEALSISTSAGLLGRIVDAGQISSKSTARCARWIKPPRKAIKDTTKGTFGPKATRPRSCTSSRTDCAAWNHPGVSSHTTKQTMLPWPHWPVKAPQSFMVIQYRPC